MSKMRGLELVAICKNRAFEIYYEKGEYYNENGEMVENLMDMICFSCGASYYTIEDEAIDFCPNCGKFEKKKFNSFTELLEWSKEQSWDFLRFSGMQVFAIYSKDRWELIFEKNAETLLAKGYRDFYKIN